MLLCQRTYRMTEQYRFSPRATLGIGSSLKPTLPTVHSKQTPDEVHALIWREEKSARGIQMVPGGLGAPQNLAGSFALFQRELELPLLLRLKFWTLKFV